MYAGANTDNTCSCERRTAMRQYCRIGALCLAAVVLTIWGGSVYVQAGIYVENLTLTVPDGAILGQSASFTASASARLDGLEQQEHDAGSAIWWKFEWWYRAPQPPNDPGTADYDTGWSLSSTSNVWYTYNLSTDMPSKLVLVRATAKIQNSSASATASATVAGVRPAHWRVPACNRVWRAG